jgi:hypothetical protein
VRVRIKELTMRLRTLGSLGASVVVIVAFAPSLSAGQTSASGAAATKQTLPRTPDGQPDLQGIWLNNDATPLERPKALEGKQFLTDKEVAVLRKNAARLFGGDVDSDAAGGDNFFLAALANPKVYKNRNATGSGVGANREIDNRTSLIVDPPDGKIPLMTPAGRQRKLAADAAAFAGNTPSPSGPEDLSNFIRCLTYGAPRLGGAAASYHNYYQIVQTPGYVMFLSEAIHDARIIPLDGRPHLPQDIRRWLGDSRGRWEGSTLVVETANYSPNSSLLGSAENLHVVERFTRIALDRIRYEMTLTDPTTWATPWTAIVRLKRTDDKMYEDACHEGNQLVMVDILAGARAAEKAAVR